MRSDMILINKVNCDIHVATCLATTIGASGSKLQVFESKTSKRVELSLCIASFISEEATKSAAPIVGSLPRSTLKMPLSSRI